MPLAYVFSLRAAILTKLELKNTLQAYGVKVGQYDAAIMELASDPDTFLIDEMEYLRTCKAMKNLKSSWRL